MAKSVADRFSSDPEAIRLFQQDRLIVDVTELICKAMNENGLKKAELAAALGTTRGYISQCLNGEKNLTLKTVSDILATLGLRMKVSAEPIETSSRTTLPCRRRP